MSLKNLDIEYIMRRLAEKRIEDAMKEGKFDNLPGAGKPLNLEPIPAGEDARLLWWALRTLKQNDVVPDEVGWRKQIDALRDQLDTATTAARVTGLVSQINLLARKVNTLRTNAIGGGVSGVSLETELRRLEDRLAEAS